MRKIVIILTIGAVSLGISQNLLLANSDEEIGRAKATIAKVELGLTRYKIVNGIFPEDGNENLVKALHPDYIVFQPEEIKEGTLIDPWGYPYIYERYDRGDNLFWRTYVIYSVGPNGANEDGKGDDIN